mgnify:FL=1
MKVKIHEVLTRKNRYKRLVFILVLFSLVLLVGILGFGLTKEKEKKVQKTEQFVSSQKVVLVNGGCENMQTNPLKEETDEQMIKAVKDTIQKRRPIRNLWRCMIILKSIQNPESTKIHMWRSSDMI